MPRVSVVMPVHDAGPFLRPALDSVLRQTLADFELICVDDGSTDGSPHVLAEAAAADPRVRVLSPGRVGLVAAANLALSVAEGEYVARFDADDVMHPQRLELQAALLDREPGIAVASCLVRHFPGPAVGEGTRVYERWLNGLVDPGAIDREFFVELPVPHPTTMARGSLIAALGGHVDDGVPEDYEYWLRAREAGARFSKVPRVLHFWREHERRVTRTHPRYSVEAFLRAKVPFLLSGPLGGGRPFVVWGAGMIGRRLTRLLARAGRPPAALLDIDRKKVGRTRHGRPVIPPEALAPGGALVLAAVGARGARAIIRERLAGWGLAEARDFWMVA